MKVRKVYTIGELERLIERAKDNGLSPVWSNKQVDLLRDGKIERVLEPCFGTDRDVD